MSDTYKQLIELLKDDVYAQVDTITVYIHGEYLPAKIEWHKNDTVDQFVLEIDDE
jgi:hypothetical protein